MLIQIDVRIQQERQIVLHPHIDRIIQCHNLKILCILMRPARYGIVQRQKILFVREKHTEHRILILPLCLRLLIFHIQFPLAGNFTPVSLLFLVDWIKA